MIVLSHGRTRRVAAAIGHRFLAVSSVTAAGASPLAIVAAGDERFAARTMEMRASSFPSAPLILMHPARSTRVDANPRGIHEVGGRDARDDLVRLLIVLDSPLHKFTPELCAPAMKVAIENELTTMETARFCWMVEDDPSAFAERFDVSAATVKTHTRSILAKLRRPNTGALWRHFLFATLSNR